jgi:hypothetical protein
LKVAILHLAGELALVLRLLDLVDHEPSLVPGLVSEQRLGELEARGAAKPCELAMSGARPLRRLDVLLLVVEDVDAQELDLRLARRGRDPPPPHR